jgi:hypothetical protein
VREIPDGGSTIGARSRVRQYGRKTFHLNRAQLISSELLAFNVLLAQMAPSKKRALSDPQGGEDPSPPVKKAKRGFRVPAPDNLPDGPWRRKGTNFQC